MTAIGLSASINLGVRDSETGEHVGSLGIYAGAYSATLHVIWTPAGGGKQIQRHVTPYELALPFMTANMEAGA